MRNSKVTSAEMSNPAVIGQFEGKCADITENNNQMTLDKPLWINLFNSEEYQRNLSNEFYIGFLGHPEDPGCQDFKNACIVMREGHIDDDGQVYGKFDLLDTPVGRIVKVMIDAGVNFGISVRGAGDVGIDGYVDPDEFIFRGFDLVAFPAYDDAIPKFTQLAASTDSASKKIYKTVCETIKDNVSDITSSSALNVIKDQFNPNSPQYKIVSDQQVELSKSSSLDSQKVQAMTDLYLTERSKVQDLQSQLESAKKKEIELSKQLKRQMRVNASMNRILADQSSRVYAENQKLSAKNRQMITANTKLKSEIELQHSQNLKYKQKVISQTTSIQDKDEVIASLRSEIRKTVAQSRRSQRDTSNLDAKIASLSQKIEACQNTLSSFQHAYLDLYSKALGVDVNIPITASTTVEDIQSMVQSGTNTGNIFANPSTNLDDVYDADTASEDIIVDNDEYSGMVTL